MVADMKKHSAGFDIVQQIREHMIIKLKKFSLGFTGRDQIQFYTKMLIICPLL